MRILYLFNKDLITSDFVTSLLLAGYEVDIIEYYECSYLVDDESCRNRISDAIMEKGMLDSQCIYDYVISYNYIPSAAYVCDSLGLIYVSWMYDSWQPTLYSDALRLPCNRIFIFDSTEYEYMTSRGIPHVYFLPLASNCERIGQLEMTDDDVKKYGCDISFLGKIYCGEYVNGYNKMRRYLDYDICNKIDDIIEGAAGRWGTDDWNYQLKSLDFSKFPKVNAEDEREKSLLDNGIYYISSCFSRAITQKDRTLICNTLSNKYNFRLYTYEKPQGLNNNVDVRPGVEYMNEMPKVFYNSKINLNITLRSIFAGIPLRVFDIMGSGGFLMTNKQKDMDNYFVDGTDYVSFNSITDLEEKVEYYLTHEEERTKIMINGYKKVFCYHTYQCRIKEMFEVLRKE